MKALNFLTTLLSLILNISSLSPLPEDDKPKNTIQTLLAETKQYLKLQKEYISLDVTYKLIVLSYTMILVFILTTLSLITLFFLAFTLAHILESHVGSFIYSYALISGGIFLLGGCIYIFRKQLIKQPLSHFLANLLLNKN